MQVKIGDGALVERMVWVLLQTIRPHRAQKADANDTSNYSTAQAVAKPMAYAMAF